MFKFSVAYYCVGNCRLNCREYQIKSLYYYYLQEAAVREGRQIGSRPTNSGGVLVVGGSGAVAAGNKEGELNTAANCDFRSGEAVVMCGWDNLANSTVLRFSHFYPRNLFFFLLGLIRKKLIFPKNLVQTNFLSTMSFKICGKFSFLCLVFS
jgi:hypothetical protein